MFCENCGNKIEEDVLFCEKCGTKIVKEESTASGAGSDGIEMNGDLESILPEKAIPEEMNQEQRDSEPVVSPDVKPSGGLSSKKTKLMIAELLVLAALLFGFYQFIQRENDPMTTAERYYRAIADQDLDQAFACLDIPEDGFMTMEFFRQAMENQELKNITSFKVLPADKGKRQQDEITFGYDMEYLISGSNEKQTASVQVVKGKDKRYYLFDEWKVSPSDMLVKRVTIRFPELAQVSVNGINLATDQIQGGEKLYTIDLLFKGTYDLTVSAPGFSPYRTEVAIESDGQNISLGLGYLNQDTAKRLTEQSNQDLQSIMTSLLNRQTSPAIANGSPARAADLNQSYEDVRRSLSVDSYTYTRSVLSDITGEDFQYETGAEGLLVYMRLRYRWDYEYTRAVSSFFGNPVTQRSSEFTGKFIYQYQDGNWLLYDFEL